MSTQFCRHTFVNTVLSTLFLSTLFSSTALACPPSRWELRAGYGWQYTNNSRPNNYQVVSLLPSLVVPLSNPVGSSWSRGRFVWNPELMLAVFIHPYLRPILGVTPLQFRYELGAIGGRWFPYGTIGAGVLYANVNRTETGSDLNFNLQGALGVRYAFHDACALLVEYRHIHMSNSHLDDQNAGLNTHNFLAGLSVEF